MPADIADWEQFDAGNRVGRAPVATENGVAVRNEAVTQCAADETGRTRYQNTRQNLPSASGVRRDCARDLEADALEKKHICRSNPQPLRRGSS